MEAISHEHFFSVVKIFVVTCSPNYSNPWQMEHQAHSTSSGFIFRERLIMCNAHGVTYAKTIRVRKHSDPTAKKYTAQVLHVGHDCDLAILTVKEDKFWENTKPLQLGGIPQLQDSIVVVGYPTGGDNICVTKGVVSRVNFVTYSHGMKSLLSIQIDAAINPGNSGGPCLQGDNVVGVAFQAHTNKQNIGYIIPVPVIEHFLEGIKRKENNLNFPSIGMSWSKLENPSHKLSLQMREDQTGIYINHLIPLTDAYKKLKQNDVVLRYDGNSIADDGTIPFRDKGERLCHHYLTIQKFSGDVAKLTILRDGKEMDVDVIVEDVPNLVPLHGYDSLNTPTYFIFGGLVFLPLTRPFLNAYYGKNWYSDAPLHLSNKATIDYKQHPDEQIIVLSHVLSNDVNVGYEGYACRMLLNVDNKEIKNMTELCQYIDTCKNDFISFDLYKDSVMVLEITKARECLVETLKTHNIPHDRSPDLVEIQKKAVTVDLVPKMEADEEKEQ
jgi:S1-C subfamily serine protease